MKNYSIFVILKHKKLVGAARLGKCCITGMIWHTTACFTKKRNMFICILSQVDVFILSCFIKYNLCQSWAHMVFMKTVIVFIVLLPCATYVYRENCTNNIIIKI